MLNSRPLLFDLNDIMTRAMPISLPLFIPFFCGRYGFSDALIEQNIQATPIDRTNQPTTGHKNFLEQEKAMHYV